MAKRCQRMSAAEARHRTLTPCSYVSHRITQSMHRARSHALHLYCCRCMCARVRQSGGASCARVARTSDTVHAPHEAPCAHASHGTATQCMRCARWYDMHLTSETGLRKQALVYLKDFQLFLHSHLRARGK